MRDDLNASEKRLIAALDRIDHFIDRATTARTAAPVPTPAPVAGGLAEIETQLHAAHHENERPGVQTQGRGSGFSHGALAGGASAHRAAHRPAAGAGP